MSPVKYSTDSNNNKVPISKSAMAKQAMKALVSVLRWRNFAISKIVKLFPTTIITDRHRYKMCAAKYLSDKAKSDKSVSFAMFC